MIRPQPNLNTLSNCLMAVKTRSALNCTSNRYALIKGYDKNLKQIIYKKDKKQIMQLYRSNYVIAITEAWIQEDYSCMCLPFLGASLTMFPMENGGKVYNLLIPLLFFDLVVVLGTRPITANKIDNN